MAKIFTLTFWAICCAACLTACGTPEPVCPPGAITYSTDEAVFPALPTPQQPAPEPVSVQIGRRTVEVDRVVSGPLCNDHLSGVVYITCDLLLKEWAGKPNFLDGCDFTVEPDTIIYVASHNDSAYYKGCGSCHISEQP